MNKIDISYYQVKDTVLLAKELLGKVLVTQFNHQLTSGIITETEAYCGINDKACHAYGGRRTSRTEIMYANGGVAYVYLCYGIHHLFNIVTHTVNQPHAILIRSIQPLDGVATMLKRRNKVKLEKKMCAGPGTLTQALGITKHHTGLKLNGNEIWVEDRGIKVDKKKIKTSPRVGIDYAGEDALLPYRFCLVL